MRLQSGVLRSAYQIVRMEKDVGNAKAVRRLAEADAQ
jgi:hypothetical protein